MAASVIHTRIATLLIYLLHTERRNFELVGSKL